MKRVLLLFASLTIVVFTAAFLLSSPAPANAKMNTAYHAYLPVVLKNFPPPPEPKFTYIQAGEPVLGETARVVLVATNAASQVPGFPESGRGYESAIVVSIPLDGDVPLQPDDVSIVSASGLTVTTAVKQTAYWITATRSTWDAGANYSLALDVRPEFAAAYTMLAKVVMYSRDIDGLPYTDPWSGEVVTAEQFRIVSPPEGASAVDASGDTCTLVQGTVSAGAFWERINTYRTQAGVAPLELRSDLASGCWNHTGYMLAHDSITHTESVSADDYTPEGDAAGQSSLLVGGNEDGTILEVPFADCMALSPFSLVQVVNPWLRWSGSAFRTDSSGGVRQAGCLDVARGIDYTAEPSWPVMWPGAVSDLRAISYEPVDTYPDPLVSCGYSAPTGTPVVVLVGDSAPAPTAVATTFQDVTTIPAQDVTHCVYTEDTYTNPDPDAQQIGRDILAENHAVVLIPQFPLQMGHCYQYSISTDRETYTGSFCTDEAVRSVLPPSTIVR